MSDACWTEMPPCGACGDCDHCYVAEAMRCVETDNAGHWPTVAGYLAAEIKRLTEERAELAEAQATIARLTEENDKHRADYRRRGAEIDRSRVIVEAATALTAHFRLGFLIGSDEEMAKWQTAHDALCHRLLAAVEEGQKT